MVRPSWQSYRLLYIYIYIFCTYVHVRELSSVDCGNDLNVSQCILHVRFFFLSFFLSLYLFFFHLILHSLFHFTYYLFPQVFSLVYSLRYFFPPFYLSIRSLLSDVIRVFNGYSRSDDLYSFSFLFFFFVNEEKKKCETKG